jgi:hypothetical protein
VVLLGLDKSPDASPVQSLQPSALPPVLPSSVDVSGMGDGLSDELLSEMDDCKLALLTENNAILSEQGEKLMDCFHTAWFGRCGVFRLCCTLDLCDRSLRMKFFQLYFHFDLKFCDVGWPAIGWSKLP